MKGSLAILLLLTLACITVACTAGDDDAGDNDSTPANAPCAGEVAVKPQALPGTPAELDAAAEAIIAERACRSCHRADDPDATIAELSPPLERVAERRPGAWLRRFLRLPYTLRPNQAERMPDLGLSDYEIEVLARWMETQAQARIESLPDWAPEREAKPRHVDLYNGRRLFVKYNCMNCHNLGEHKLRIQRDDEGNVVFQHAALQAPDLSHTWQRVRPGWLYAMIQDPPDWMPWGKMPPLDVSEEDAKKLAWYLANAVPTPESSATGVEIEALLKQRCGACHNDDALDLTTLDGAFRGTTDAYGNARPGIVPHAENSPVLYFAAVKKPHPETELTDTELETLRTWILAGALRD